MSPSLPPVPAGYDPHQEVRASPARTGQGRPKTSRAEFARKLQRFGYPANVIEEIATQVGDPVDLSRDRQILERYGVTPGHLKELMGASP